MFPQANKDSVNAHFQAYNLTSIEQARPKLSNTEQALFIRTKAVPVKMTNVSITLTSIM
jgi:hypothetical protein